MPFCADSYLNNLLPLLKVNAKLPAESTEADVENHKKNGETLLYVFGRGLAAMTQLISFFVPTCMNGIMPKGIKSVTYYL